MSDIAIAGAVRTAIGKFGGALAKTSALDGGELDIALPVER